MDLRRRRVPRQPAGWFGKCIVDDDKGASWSECRVIDVSIIGAGIELYGFVHRDLVGRHVTVEVQAPTGASVSVCFTGEVMNAGRGPVKTDTMQESYRRESYRANPSYMS